jgi:hypothetical protein
VRYHVDVPNSGSKGHEILVKHAFELVVQENSTVFISRTSPRIECTTCNRSVLAVPYDTSINITLELRVVSCRFRKVSTLQTSITEFGELRDASNCC